MNKFEEYRRKKDLTQMELAVILGVDQTAISRWEKGKGFPSAGKLPEVAAVLGCTIDELFEREDEAVREGGEG